MVARSTNACSSAAAPDAMPPGGPSYPSRRGRHIRRIRFCPGLHPFASSSWTDGIRHGFPARSAATVSILQIHRTEPDQERAGGAFGADGSFQARWRLAPPALWADVFLVGACRGMRSRPCGGASCRARSADAGEGHGREEHAVRVRAGGRHDLASGLQAGLLDPRAGPCVSTGLPAMAVGPGRIEGSRMGNHGMPATPRTRRPW